MTEEILCVGDFTFQRNKLGKWQQLVDYGRGIDIFPSTHEKWLDHIQQLEAEPFAEKLELESAHAHAEELNERIAKLEAENKRMREGVRCSTDCSHRYSFDTYADLRCPVEAALQERT